MRRADRRATGPASAAARTQPLSRAQPHSLTCGGRAGGGTRTRKVDAEGRSARPGSASGSRQRGSSTFRAYSAPLPTPVSSGTNDTPRAEPNEVDSPRADGRRPIIYYDVGATD